MPSARTLTMEPVPQKQLILSPTLNIFVICLWLERVLGLVWPEILGPKTETAIQHSPFNRTMYSIGQSVNCFCGKGKIEDIRDDGVHVVKLDNWALAQGQSPTLYLNQSAISPAPLYSIGQQIICFCGKGSVESIREDGIYVVKLHNWTLAQGQSPTLYLQESALSLDTVEGANDRDSKATEESTESSIFDECIARVIKLKAEAQPYFSASDFETARSKYLDCLTAMQYLNDGLTNSQKAIVFEQSVPCHNNISLCCMNMKAYADSIAFAKNGVLLIDALEKRRAEGSAVWNCLITERGLTEEKLRGWKKKSLFFMGKAELFKQDYADAIIHLDAALKLIDKSEEKSADALKIKELLVQAKKVRSQELKREKSTWTKAFKESKSEDEAAAAAAAAAASNPTTPLSGSPSDSFASVKKLLGEPSVSNPSSPSKKNSNKSKKDTEGTLSTHTDNYMGWLAGFGLLGLVAGGITFFMLRSKRFR